MRKHRKPSIFAAAALFVVGGVAVAYAQAPGRGAAAASGKGGPVAVAEGAVARMEANRASVRRMLETARSQRDVVKTLCLNDKLNQFDKALQLIRERKAALESAVQRGDTDRTSHESTMVTAMQSRGDQLMTEASQCIGKELQVVDKASVTTSIDANMPGEGAVGQSLPPPFIVPEAPTCASCTK